MLKRMISSVILVALCNTGFSGFQTAKRQEPSLEIKTAGWNPSKLTPLELGKRIDNALQTLKSASLEVTYRLDDAEGSGGTNLKGLVQDSKNYYLQYSLPTDQASISQFVADGKRRGAYESGKWIYRESIATKRNSPDGSKLVDVWPQHFPKYGLLPATGPWAVWQPLLKSWNAGVGGYKVRVEERQMLTMGKKKSYFRILATREKPYRSQIECVFDGQRFVPLTMRANLFPPNKKPSKYMWTCHWKFNQKMDTKLFKVP